MIANHDPLVQALLAGFFTWFVTACGKSNGYCLFTVNFVGAAMVYLIPSNSKKFLDTSLGFAAGGKCS
jgi:hypothetical protein